MLSIVEEMKYRQIAVEMIKRGARAPIVKSMSPLDMKTISRLYLDVTGNTSPTGPLPSDPGWFASTTVPWRLIQASFFAGMYESISTKSPDAFEAEVLIQTYDIYLQHCEHMGREPQLNLNRCWALMRLLKTHELDMTECTVCHDRIIQHAFSLKTGFVCCLCHRTASLKPHNWSKANQKAA